MPIMAREKPRYRVRRRGRYLEGDSERIERAIELLRDARDLFVDAGAVITAARVRLAISSALGARRNAGYRLGKTQRGEV